jgi:hypothetical protein
MGSIEWTRQSRPHSYINTCSLPPGILFPKTLKMGQTSDHETLIIHQKMSPGNNPEDFKQKLLSSKRF